MATTSSSTPVTSGFSLTLSSTATYIFLVIALVASIFFAYVYQVFPTVFGQIGIGTSLTGIIAYIVHDLEGAHTPNGWPTYTTFLVVSLSSAAYGAVGVFTASTLLELGAFLTWALAFASFLNTYVGEYGTASLTAGELAFATAAIGAVVAFLTWSVGNPNATLGAILITAVFTFAQWFHLTENGGTTTTGTTGSA